VVLVGNPVITFRIFQTLCRKNPTQDVDSFLVVGSAQDMSINGWIIIPGWCGE
jgi:hypothetical protein